MMPFLENVLCGKNVPRERMLQVAEHYYHFGGKSPINDQNRLLINALKDELAEHGPRLPGQKSADDIERDQSIGQPRGSYADQPYGTKAP